MRFIFGPQDFATEEKGEENCYLMTNGLGGFSSLTIAGSCSRNDHALLMSCSAAEAPNHRYNMIHRLEEILVCGEEETHLSTQSFGHAAGSENEEGYRFLSSFIYEDYPVWRYEKGGVEVLKTVVLAQGENTVGVSYEIWNRSTESVALKVIPQMEFVSKGVRLSEEQDFSFEEEAGPEQGGEITGAALRSNGRSLYLETNGTVQRMPLRFQGDLYYAYDACDGRMSTGCTAANHCVLFRVSPGERILGEIVYSTEPVSERWSLKSGGGGTARMAECLARYREDLRETAGFKSETAGVLAAAAHQFISYRASTEKETILAGFPFFEDWGRDTMIALPGCCMSTGQYETAERILRTFMMYCRRGLMPNLFPEGKQEPQYNTADAALLFIIAVYEYYSRTGDRAFAVSAWAVMQEIIERYEKGTDFNICMEEDGLIRAGEGYDQVTWMDVRVGEILPTPRHGKPVEINAYWYNALCVMDQFKRELKGDISEDGKDYDAMAALTRKSFREKFWNASASCLRDVLSPKIEEQGTGDRNGSHGGAPVEGRQTDTGAAKVSPDAQIRCNQIWAVSLPFPLLDREQEKQVVETVYRRLYTPLGLRTLDPEDPEFRPVYGGEQLERDLAYHQGTVWTYPLGGYYLAYLKVNDYSEEAKAHVWAQLETITAALREGCIGQLPEIYDGGRPVHSKGCFAQAWSVGEILRVYEALERDRR